MVVAGLVWSFAADSDYLSPVMLWSVLCGATLFVLISLMMTSSRNLRRVQRDEGFGLLSLYRQTPAMLHELDANGQIRHVSQAWLDFLGYHSADVLGTNFFDLVAPGQRNDLCPDHTEKLKRLGPLENACVYLTKACGATVLVALSHKAQTDSSGLLTGYLGTLNDLSSHHAAEEQVERLAYYDSLTGLPNRALMSDRIIQALAQARREGRQLGVFFIDLDRFKLINDTQGHAVGDLVLRSVAQRLKKFIRQGDTFARLGGDEFVIVQADPNHDPNFTILGRRILDTLSQPFQVADRELYATASIGVAIYPVDGQDSQALLKCADIAMYAAKSRGRNNMQFFSEDMNQEARERTDLESHLRQALARSDLQQHYQPLVNVMTGRIMGVEALLRWHDKDGRLISPSHIIDIAEESGLVVSLGQWALQTACRQFRAWQDLGVSPLRMSVNLSGLHIRQTNFIDDIEAILKNTGVRPNSLEIELAENSLMGYVNESIMALTDLKIRGIHLSIDNFGTGYSSLLYLKHLPIQRIKIAREFILEIAENPDYAAITEAILRMAKSLDLQVAAVGVEDPEQLALLKQLGCTEVQGSLFGRVMSAKHMTDFLVRAQGQVKPCGSLENQCEFTLEGSTKIH